MGEMLHTRRALSKHNTIMNWVLLVAVPLVIIWIEFKPVQIVETRLNPVMVNGTFGDIVSVSDLGVIVSADGFKRRECRWEETRFYIGTRDGAGSRLRSARHLSKPVARGTGWIHWDEIFLPILPEQFATGSFYADVVHTCAGRDVVSELFTRIKGVDQ